MIGRRPNPGPAPGPPARPLKMSDTTDPLSTLGVDDPVGQKDVLPPDLREQPTDRQDLTAMGQERAKCCSISERGGVIPALAARGRRG